MVRIAHIEGGEVKNISLAPGIPDGEPDAAGVVCVLASGNVRIGDQYIAGAFVTPPPPPPTLEEYQSAVQQALDDKAREKNYDGILSLCTYAASAIPTFAAEGLAGVGWRDGAWAKCYELLGQWQSGLIPQPTIAEVLASLPAMEWPA